MRSMISLGRKRADRLGAKAWTPREMLEDLLREDEAGLIDLSAAIVIFPTATTEDRIEVEIRKAGVNIDDELVMLRSAFKQSAQL